MEFEEDNVTVNTGVAGLGWGLGHEGQDAAGNGEGQGETFDKIHGEAGRVGGKRQQEKAEFGAETEICREYFAKINFLCVGCLLDLQ